MKFSKPSPFTLVIVLHVIVLVATAAVLLTRKKSAQTTHDKIVIVPVEGVITYETGSLNKGASVDAIVETLEELRDDSDVKAVVLRINSPGGSVGAVQEIHRAVLKFRGKGKYVVSSFGDVAASGGYYIACAGDKIVSNPGTLTGSIGVIMQIPNVKGLFEKIGVSMITIKSGDMKDSASPFRAMSEDERKYFTRLILDTYAQFFDAVKTGRKMDEAALKPLADGRVFTGKMAKELNLVDELGGVEEAVELAKKLAGLEGKKPKIIHHKGANSLERLLNLLSKEPLAPFSKISNASTSLEYMLR
jgi:protease-4